MSSFLHLTDGSCQICAHLNISACSVGAVTLRGGWLWSVVPLVIFQNDNKIDLNFKRCGGLSPNLLDGETGRAAGEPCEAMKSASCRRAHRLEELPPFFICSWISTSSSSLNDWTQTQRLEIYRNAGEKKNTARRQKPRFHLNGTCISIERLESLG